MTTTTNSNSKDVKVSLNYTRNEGKRTGVRLAKDGKGEKPIFDFRQKPVEVTIRDARAHPNLAFDTNGFELFSCPTKLSDLIALDVLVSCQSDLWSGWKVHLKSLVFLATASKHQ